MVQEKSHWSFTKNYNGVQEMSDTTTIIIFLLVLIFLCFLMFVWYVSDMFDLLRYKIDVLEKQLSKGEMRQGMRDKE